MFSRSLVLVSALLAVLAYLLTIRVSAPAHAATGLAAAVAAGIGARIAPRVTGRVIVGLAFVAPAALSLALGGSPAYFLTLWLVPAVTWLVLVAPTASWSLPARWRPLLVAWMLAVAACWPIVFLRELDFTPAMLWSPTANGLAPGAVWWWANGVATEALAEFMGVLWLDWLAAPRSREAARRLVTRDVLVPAGLGLLVATGVACYQWWVDLSWLSTIVWRFVRRAPGPFFDANAVGMVGATWGVLLAALLRSWWPSRRAALLAGGVLVAGWLAVFASGSRTALMVGAVGTLSLLTAELRGRLVTPRRAVAAALLFVVFAVALLVEGSRPTSPVRRLAATLPAMSAEGLGAFAHRMWDRDGWGSASTQAILEHPVTGIGLGTFNRQSVDYHFRLTGGPITVDNAQNWWRQMTAEWGMFGAAISVAWALAFGWFLVRGRARDEERVAAAAVRGLLFGLAFVALLSVPSQPIARLTVWTLIFLAWHLWGEPGRESHPGRWRGWSAIVTVLVLLAVSTQAYAAWHDLRPPVRMQRVGESYGYGFWRGGKDASGNPYWWTGRRAVFVFPMSAGEFQFVVAPLHPDLARQPVRVRVWVGNRKVVDLAAGDRSPIALRIPVAAEDRAVFIETRVDRTYRGDRNREVGLRVQKGFTPAAR